MREYNTKPILIEDLGIIKKGSRKYKYGRYKCRFCGNIFDTEQKKVNKRQIGSCGCQSKSNKSYDITKLPLYNTWYAMKRRCHSTKDDAYHLYGARGIKVCDRWLDINNFIEDMYPSFEEGLTLDRVDVNGDYEPNNCRWATQYTQMQNTRDIGISNTSGFRGVSYSNSTGKWNSRIRCNNIDTPLGVYKTALEAAKAYEIYVRINNLEHNFTPALTEDELDLINSFQQYLVSKNKNVTKMYKSFVTLLLI